MSDRGEDEGGGGEENFQLVTVTNHNPEWQRRPSAVSLSFNFVKEWVVQK